MTAVLLAPLGVAVGTVVGAATVATIALDPNQVVIAGGAVIVSFLGLLGVMAQQGKRLRSVDRKTEQLQRNGGDSLLDASFATRSSVDSIRTIVNSILENQTEAIAGGMRVLAEVADLRVAQSKASDRTDHLERSVDALRTEMSNLRVQFEQGRGPITGPNPIQGDTP